MRKFYSFGNRALSLLLSLVLVIGMMPVGISVAHADEGTVSYAAVSVEQSSLTVSGNGSSAVEITNAETITLNYTADNSWRIGVKITAPSDVQEDATYTSSSAAEAIKFSEAEDTPEGSSERYLWVYGSIDQASLAEAVVEYTWEFDWNADGTNEQSVTLSVDPARVILLDENEERVYPSVYGTLSSTYGGTLTGANTADTVLTISGAVVPYDTEACAWRIDVTFTAPAHITTALEGENEFQSPTTYYLELQPDGENYTVNGELSRTFYWDGVEQKMTLKAENALLIQEQELSIEAEGDITYGGTATYTVTGIKSEKTPIFSIEGDCAEIIESVGNTVQIKATGMGTFIIRASVDGDGTYAAAPVTKEVTVGKADQDLSLVTEVATVDNNTEIYTIAIASDNGAYAEDAFVYTIQEADSTMGNTTVSDEGVITIGSGDYGQIVVRVTNEGNDYYEPWEGADFTLTVTQIEVANTSFVVEGTEGNNGWYVSEVVITCEGYKLAEPKPDNQKPEDCHCSGHKEEYSLSVDGVYENLYLCLKKIEGRGINHGNDQETVNLVGTLKIDQTDPKTEIKYTSTGGEILKEIFSLGFHNREVNATITATDATSGIAKIFYTTNGGTDWNEAEITLAEDGKSATFSFTIQQDSKSSIGYYAVDVAGNKNQDDSYQEIIIEDDAPACEVTWSEAINIDNNTWYYNDTATATIVITEANFDGSLIKIKDNDQAVSNVSWTDNEDGTYTATVSLSQEGEHTLKIEGKDLAGNESAFTAPETIVIDYTAPVIILEEDLNGTCTNQVVTTQITVVEHNFAASNVTVTLKGESPAVESHEVEVAWTEAKDHRGETIEDTYVAEVTVSGDSIYTLNVAITDPADHADAVEATFTVEMTDPTNLNITYSDDVWGEVLEAITFGYYNAQMTVTISAEDATSGVAEICYNYDGEWHSAAPDTNGEISFAIDPQYRGNVQYYAVDKAGNDSDPVDGQTTLVVDTIKPGINVSWSDAITATSETRYYAGEAVATVVITEANFFDGEDVNISGGTFDGAWIAATDADGNEIENAWANTITVVDEGDHSVTISYTDRSKNEMDTYTSETIVIDYTAPVITASINTGATRQYYNQSQTITIQVTEKNFDAGLVEFALIEADYNGDETQGNVQYGEWVPQGNHVYTREITFTGDANYTLNATCKDLAGRSSVMDQQLFTVDKVAPVEPTVTYSQSLKDVILNKVSFGYYNAQVTVTLRVSDAVAGVDSFAYEYILNEGVSNVNKAGSGTVAAIPAGNSFTASFQVPAAALTANNQFNGYISFTAIDRSGNILEFIDTDDALVVDNIAPTAEISYNDPVKTVGDVSYYDGQIQANINIREANFFSQDVQVTVTKDGAAYDADVSWTNAGMGTFTLTEEGNYTVKVAYTDRSGNAMATYTSGTLVLDTTAPEVEVSNIVNQSANTDSIYTFSVTASDSNIDAETFLPVLTALVHNEDGTFTTETIAWAAVEEITAGETYAVTVENLELDAIYTLTCSVTDLSGNRCTTMVLEDGKSYGQVQFSINRNGSTFYLDENTMALVSAYYTQNVTNDLVIVEINPDTLESYAVTLNGKELTEGEDYTVTSEGGDGSWMQYTYTISKDLLTEEGEYQLVISSKDEAGNNTFSDVKGATVSFVVDRTAPIITVTGMAENGRYQVENQTVTVIPMDDGGALNTLVISLVDDNGNTIKELVNLSGEELQEALENGDGRLSFQIGTGLYQNVRVVCTDCAADESGATNVYDETVSNISVSSSGFMIFWANTALRYGVIAGIIALLFILILLLKRKKDKKDK